MMEFVNGKDDMPFMKWNIKFMFETTNSNDIYPLKIVMFPYVLYGATRGYCQPLPIFTAMRINHPENEVPHGTPRLPLQATCQQLSPWKDHRLWINFLIFYPSFSDTPMKYYDWHDSCQSLFNPYWIGSPVYQHHIVRDLYTIHTITYIYPLLYSIMFQEPRTPWIHIQEACGDCDASRVLPQRPGENRLEDYGDIVEMWWKCVGIHSCHLLLLSILMGFENPNTLKRRTFHIYHQLTQIYGKVFLFSTKEMRRTCISGSSLSFLFCTCKRVCWNRVWRNNWQDVFPFNEIYLSSNRQ